MILFYSVEVSVVVPAFGCIDSLSGVCLVESCVCLQTWLAGRSVGSSFVHISRISSISSSSLHFMNDYESLISQHGGSSRMHFLSTEVTFKKKKKKIFPCVQSILFLFIYFSILLK